MAGSGPGTLLESLYYELDFRDEKFKEGLKAARDEADKAHKVLLRAELAAEKAAAKLAKLERSSNASAGALDKARRAAELAARDLARAKDAAAGADAALAKMDQSVSRFARLGGAILVAAAGAAAGALQLVAVAAVRMAAESEAAITRVQNLTPGAADGFRRIADSIDSVTFASGRARGEIVATADAIARNGVEGVSDLANRLDVVTRAADASGGSLEAIAGGLDQVLDLFNLNAAAAELVAAKIVQLGKGRGPIEDVFNALAFAAPALSRMGLDFDTASAALTTLVNNGFKVRQAGSELAKYAELGDEGREAIERLAEQSRTTATALDEMNEAAGRTRETTERAGQRIREELNANLRDLGNNLLPLVNAGLKTLNFLLGGEQGQRNAREMAERIRELRGEVQGLSEDSRKAVADGSRLFSSLGGKVGTTDELLTLFGSRVRPVTTTPTAGSGAGSGLGVLSPEEIARRQEAARKAAADAKRLREEAERDAERAAQVLRGIARDLAVETAALANETVGQFVGIIEQFKDRTAALPDSIRDAATESLRQLQSVQLNQLAVRVAADIELPNEFPEHKAAAFRERARELLAEAFTLDANTVGKVVEQLEREAKALRDAAKAREEKEEAEKRAEKKRDEAAKKAKEAADREREALSLSREKARALADAARGALNLATALGIVGDEARDTLQAIVDIGTGIGPLTTVIEQMKKLGEDGKPLAGIGDLVGAALPVIGGIATLAGGLFGGPSPAEEEANRRREENTAAIHRLTEAVNHFTDITSSGRTFAGARESLADEGRLGAVFASAQDRLGTKDFLKFLRGELAVTQEEFATFGLTLEEFHTLAAEAGIAVRDGLPSFEDLVAVGKALQHQEFNRFAETFGGQLDFLNRKFRFFETSGQDQFDGLIELLTDPQHGAPAIFDALKGLDLSSADGIAKAKQLIQEIFSGFSDFSIEDFGGLGPDEFFAVLEQLFTILGGIDLEDGNAFAEALQRVRDGFRVFDVDDPAAQAKAFLDVMQQFSPAIRDLLGDLDLTTSGGLATARERLQAFYTAVVGGSIDISESGIAVEDLIGIIELLGIQIEETVATIRSALSDLAEEADALGLTPLQHLTEGFARLADLAPEIADALADLDLTTVEGLREADKRLGALFLKAKSGEIDLDTSDILAFQDLLRNALSFLVRETDEATREYERAMEDQRRAAEETARAAREAAEAERRRRYETADRAIAQLANENRLFDVDSPVQQLVKLVDVLKTGAPIFKSILGDADVGTTEGRAQALEAVRLFFLRNPNGVESGFFSKDQQLDQLLGLGELLKEAGISGDITGAGTASSFAVNQQITSVQGDRIFGGIITSNALLGSIDTRIAAMLALMGGPTVGTVLPPVMPEGVVPGGTSMVVHIHVNGEGTSATLSPSLSSNLRSLMESVAREILFSAGGM